jgi:DNA end-binding protein Ku
MATRRPTWRGHLKLSLVTCPVALYSAISPAGDIHFHLINPQTGHRIRQVAVDATTERPVNRADLVRGFEVTKGRYVTLTAEEIDAVKLESTKTIDIEAFVPASEIDRLYWDNPYFLVPDGKLATESFAVILAAMEKAGQVALGRVVIADRERLLALEPRGRIIVATTLRSFDEVRDFRELVEGAKPTADADMVAIATKIMKQKATSFNPKTFTDRYEEALRALIKRKQKGQKLLAVDEPEARSNVIDLMEALKQSVRGGADSLTAKKAAPKKRSSAKKSPRKRA